MVLGEAEIVRSVACTSMLVAFMSSGSLGIPQNIDKVEAVCRLLKVVLETVGDTHYMHSCYFLWSSFTIALLDMETQVFPDLPPETPKELALPTRWGSLDRLQQPGWHQYFPWIHPAHAGLELIFHWIREHYDAVIHDDILSRMSDALLVLESISAVTGVPFAVPLQPIHSSDDEPEVAQGERSSAH